MLSKCNRALLEAIEKGYYAKGEKVFSKNKELTLSVNKDGYKHFAIRFGKERYKIAVHRLVAYQKFGEVIFEKGIQVRHLDGDPGNNDYNNISVGTPVDNAADKKPGVELRAALIASSFVKVHDHENIQKDRQSGMNYKQLMEKYEITSKGTLSYIINKAYNLKK